LALTSGSGRVVGSSDVIMSANHAPLRTSYQDGRLSHPCWQRGALDGDEGIVNGVPKHYRKEQRVVQCEGHDVVCLVYIDPKSTGGQIRGEYIDRMAKAAIDARLPDPYVERYFPPDVLARMT